MINIRVLMVMAGSMWCGVFVVFAAMATTSLGQMVFVMLTAASAILAAVAAALIVVDGVEPLVQRPEAAAKMPGAK